MVAVGEMFGSLLSGRIVDKINNKAAVIVNIILLIFCWACTFSVIRVDEPDDLLYIFALSWGLMDGAISTHAA